MESSEIEKKLLNNYLSRENLNSLIQTTTCLKTLNCLLQIKKQRISEGKCEKLSFSIESIYIDDNYNTIDLKNQVLENALQLMEDPDKHILQAIKYLTKKLYFSQNEDELYHSFNLLHVIMDYYKDKNVSLNIKNELDGIYEPVLKVIRNAPKRLIIYALLHFLPSYINICSEQTSSLLFQNIFELVKTTNRLEIICLLFDNFASKPFDLTSLNDYWLLLETCISSKDSYLQKQAVYLLSKSVYRYSKNYNLLPNYLKPENDLADFEKIWRNYFILLDVSNEKQLHIIEPSLPLFNSIRSLHPLWRVCLYKMYLNHSQNSIVYSIAMHILQNELEWSNFSQILPSLLGAINKNEFSANSMRIFEKIGIFSTKLDHEQFEFLIQESLSLTWVPAAIWSLYSNIFDERTQFQLSFSLLEDIFKQLKLLPHTYIREACLRIVLNYCINNFVYGPLDEFLKFSSLLLKIDETSFEHFIQNHKEKIQNHIDNLLEEFAKGRNEAYKLWIEIVIKIFKILQTKISQIPHFEKFSEVTDLIYFNLFDYFAFDDAEKYVIKRIDSIQNHDNVNLLVLLSKNICSSKIIKKSLEILLENDRNRFTSTQQILAFGIINNTSYCEDYRKIVNFWKSKFLSSNEKINNNLTAAYLQLYHKHLSNSSDDEDEILEAINILQNILDSQSETVFIIIENIQVLLKHSNSSILSQFIDRCFEEFLNLSKTSNFKTTANNFLSQLYHSDSLENYILCNKLLTFSQSLLKISNNYNTIASIASEKIARLSENNPRKAVIFIPVIVEFILHGIIINKNERVEYAVCQDILRHNLSLDENNPNLEEISVRLWGLEAMLHLLKNQNSDGDVANQFVNLFVGQYMKHFNRRYFPDSQIHLHKLRIMQALLLLHSYITQEKTNLVNIIIESFLLESHQPSVKHLMQWLLINLLKNDSSLELIDDKLKRFDNSRPSTVSGFIPVLYHLTLYQDEGAWDQIVEMLLPCTMGPQFKLRVYSQVALLKLYEKAAEKKYISFLDKHKFLYTSLKQVVEASGNETININQEFLDYFSLENCDCSTIYHTIPKTNKVAVYEWENLQKCALNKQFKHLSFGIEASHSDTIDADENQTRSSEHRGNIQKKITPWKDMMNDNSTEYTNNFILVTTLLEKPANLGGLSRTCEVFGIKQLAMKTSKIASDKEFKSLSMSSENWVDIMEVKPEDLQSFILDIKTKGYCVIGAEQTSESVSLGEFKFAKKTVLVLGNEKEGIPANIIPLLDNCIEIPQFGVVRSLNVHVAGAIIIWEYCKQHQL